MEQRVTFGDIVKHNGDVVTYSDSRVAILRGVPHVREDAFLLDGVYVCILCVSGEASFTRNEGCDFEVRQRDFLISHPNRIIRPLSFSGDFSGLGLVFSQEYFDKFLLYGGNRWNVRQFLDCHNVIHLSDNEADEMRDDFDYLVRKSMRASGPHATDVLDLLIRAVLVNCYDVVSKFYEQKNSDIRPKRFSAAEQLLNRFVNLVEERTPAAREVSDYARELCVTAKYISTICRAQTGMTARQIISESVARKLRRLLSDPNLSIKEIAEKSGFSNLSFFGKYVKRELGDSPRNLRRPSPDIKD